MAQATARIGCANNAIRPSIKFLQKLVQVLDLQIWHVPEKDHQPCRSALSGPVGTTADRGRHPLAGTAHRRHPYPVQPGERPAPRRGPQWQRDQHRPSARTCKACLTAQQDLAVNRLEQLVPPPHARRLPGGRDQDRHPRHAGDPGTGEGRCPSCPGESPGQFTPEYFQNDEALRCDPFIVPQILPPEALRQWPQG